MSRRTGNRSMVSRNVPLLASEADCERGKSSYQLAKRAAFRSASITYSRLRTSDFRSPARCIASSVSGASSTLMRFAAVRCSNASTNCSGPCRSVRSCETLPRELRRHLRVSLTSRPGRLLAWLRDRALAYGSSQDWAAKRYRPTRGQLQNGAPAVVWKQVRSGAPPLLFVIRAPHDLLRDHRMAVREYIRFDGDLFANDSLCWKSSVIDGGG